MNSKQGTILPVPSTLQARLSVAIETHGCKLNQADSATLAARFKAAGFDLVGTDEAADVYLVNSCTVTHVADRKARQSIRSARRRNPSATIVATGCYAERDAAAFGELPEIDLLAGNGDKVRLVQDVVALRGGDASTCGTGSDDVPISPGVLRTRAMVKIQEGCDQVCAYCIVPRVRGRERSVPPADIVSQINRLVGAGYREVVLTGTQLGTYGFDLPQDVPNTLSQLISEALDGTAIERIRVSSLQPQEMDEELLSLWSDQRLCPHFHMPLQSGSDAVLKRMRRRYTAGLYERAVGRVRELVPNAGITGDVIAGFPGETDADFQLTYDLAQRVGFSDLHVFPFSARPGTTAAHFEDDVSSVTRSGRVAELIELGTRTGAGFRDGLLGTARPVLWEGRRNGNWSGLTDNYVRVSSGSVSDLFNQVVQTRLVSQSAGVVAGIPVPVGDGSRR
jgi:threonylcarbamoyladenosine tRNA methylthiotransferase MtaB